jgi:hypothetical protein
MTWIGLIAMIVLTIVCVQIFLYVLHKENDLGIFEARFLESITLCTSISMINFILYNILL